MKPRNGRNSSFFFPFLSFPFLGERFHPPTAQGTLLKTNIPHGKWPLILPRFQCTFGRNLTIDDVQHDERPYSSQLKVVQSFVILTLSIVRFRPTVDSERERIHRMVPFSLNDLQKVGQTIHTTTTLTN